MHEWNEALGVAEATTRTRCEADPNFDGVYRALESWERDAHRRQWDHPDNIAALFQVIRAPHPQTDVALNAKAAVGVGRCYMQDGFEGRCHARDGNVGVALLDVAALCEHMRKEADEDGYHGDLLLDEPLEGFELYGIGILNEIWAVSFDGRTPEEAEEIIRAGGDRRLKTHPDRQEMRQLYLAGRDGIMWTATRCRGERLRVIAELPDSDLRSVGNIVHGLSRITNALVSNPVPIWPRTHKPKGEDFWKAQHA